MSHEFEKGNEFGKNTRFKKQNCSSVKFKTEYCDKLIEYFSQPYTQIVNRKKYDSEGRVIEEIPEVRASEYPTFEGFAQTLGVTTKTLKNWCARSRRFSYCYARAREAQYARLTNNALLGLYSPSYAKFEATNNHNQHEKTEIETTEKEVFDEATKRLIERAARRLAGDE